MSPWTCFALTVLFANAFAAHAPAKARAPQTPATSVSSLESLITTAPAEPSPSAGAVATSRVVTIDDLNGSLTVVTLPPITNAATGSSTPTSSTGMLGSITSSSSSAASSSSSTTPVPSISPQSPAPSKRLSNSAKIGIGVGVPVGFLIVLLVAFCLLKRIRRNRRRSSTRAKDHPSLPKDKGGLSSYEKPELEARVPRRKLPWNKPELEAPPRFEMDGETVHQKGAQSDVRALEPRPEIPVITESTRERSIVSPQSPAESHPPADHVSRAGSQRSVIGELYRNVWSE